MLTFPLRKLAVIFGLLSVGLLLTSDRAAANEILASSFNNPCTSLPCGYEGDPTFQLYQQFTLTATVSIASIDEDLAYTFDTPMLASNLIETIINDSSNSPGNTVLATDTGVTGTLSVYNNYSDVNFAFGSVTLGPGVYWLDLTDNLGATYPVFNWDNENSPSTDPAGPGGYFDQLMVYDQTQRSSDVLTAAINGTIVSGVPEPATVFSSLGALVAIWLMRSRTRLGSRTA
jgi:hypothetical protein